MAEELKEKEGQEEEKKEGVELSADEEKKLREEISKEVWEGAEADLPRKAEKETPSASSQEETPTDGDKDKQVKVEEEDGDGDGQEGDKEDPWEGVNPALKKTLENITYRLKQTESRIGSVQNKLFNEEQAKSKKQQADAGQQRPPEEKASTAPKEVTLEEWEQFKEDFPEIAAPLEERLSAIKVETDPQILQQMQEALQNEINSVREAFSAELERRTLTLSHRDWEKIIQSQEYNDWLADQPDEIQDKTLSPYAADAIEVLDRFKASRKARKKSPSEIASERERRLRQSMTLQTSHSEQPVKSELDMTEAELRQKIAREVWGE